MAEISPGPFLGPPRKKRKQTQTEKSHRFESFTKRVAKLKIDPVHQVQQSRLNETPNDLSQSYFRTALDEWSELNLSATFTSFRNKTNPLCESLPQLLHHVNTVVDILLDHISKEDPLALEALLSLVAHLAHDLGQEFEQYFTRTAALVAKVSTTQEDPVVVESCFTCLAWMYKYLSRSLVKDMQPLLTITLPYFNSRKDYIRRFTAESLAFLLRKAAMLYQQNKKPLTIAVRYLLQSSNTSSSHALFSEASMILLAECATGVEGGLHSSAPSLLECLFHEVATLSTPSDVAAKILEGVTVNLIHHTNAAGFEPWLNTILQSPSSGPSQKSIVDLSARLVLVVCTTRDGSRIREWQGVLTFTQNMMSAIDFEQKAIYSPRTKTSLRQIVATIIQNAPLNHVLPTIPSLVDKVISLSEPSEFFSFCEVVARLGKTRFQDLLLPHLQKYIVSNWSKDEAGLTLLLHDLSQLGYVHKSTSSKSALNIGDDWESSKVTGWKPKKDDSSDKHSDSLDLLLAQAVQFPRSREATESWERHLREQLKEALKNTSQPAELPTRTALGWGLEALTTLSKDKLIITHDQWASIAILPKDRFQILPFVVVCAQRAERWNLNDVADFVKNNITAKVMSNMLNPSLGLRKASLELLRFLHRGESGEWVADLIDLLQEINGTAYTMSNARQIAMLVRRLPAAHKTVPENHSLSSLVPFFCLGLLSNYHDQLRKDVSASLGQTLTSITLEETVMEIVSEWLQSSPVPKLEDGEGDTSQQKRISSFECTKLNDLDDLAANIARTFNNPAEEAVKRVEAIHTPSNAVAGQTRAIALQVLQDIPQIAEKRSRIVIPPFLAAQRERSGHDVSLLDESNSVHTVGPEIETSGWTLKDRRSFLQLLGQFNNPRTLYRAEEVFTILLELLSNGDSETKKLSLLALMKWKNQKWTTYKDQLVQVAEGKMTNSELGTMLVSESDICTIKVEDKADVFPVLLRLVFGELVSRAGTQGSQEAKRKSLLRLVFRMDETDVDLFLNILLGRYRDVSLDETNENRSHLLSQDITSLDQQYGFLRMVLSMLEILQTRFHPYGNKILDAVLHCTIRASRQIDSLSDTDATPALLRSARRTGIQCLNLIFDYCPQLNLNAYLELLYTDLIEPRLAEFVSENAQGVSGLLKIFAVWTKRGNSFNYLLYRGDLVLQKLWHLLEFASAKDEVKIFILEAIVSSALDLSDNESTESKSVTKALQFQTDLILDSIATLLQQNPSKSLLLTATKVVERLADLTGPSETKWRIVKLLIAILQEPNQRLAPHIRSQVLKCLLTSAKDLDVAQLQSLCVTFLPTISGYLDFFRDLPNRQTCIQILRLIANNDPQLQKVVDICDDLNARSSSSLDEVDQERQAQAFSQIHHLLDDKLELKSLLPVLHNLIFCVRSSDETAVRGNALSCLKHMIRSLPLVDGDLSQFQQILLTAVRKHMRNDSELVRADFAELLGSAVENWQDLPELAEMQPLLVDGDEEASFFTNILHIQQHRRTRAIRRLVTGIEQGHISSQNISQFFIPLLQKFTEDENGDASAQNARGQTLASMSVILQWLDWKSFRSIFRHYRQSLDQKREEDKIDVRLLSHAADALTTAIRSQHESEILSAVPHLTSTLPTQAVIDNELKTNFIPKLAELSHYKDEGEISQRIPAAVVAVKLIKLLPQDQHALLAAPIVLDVAQILRSRTQETRDHARKKLAEIVFILGSSSVQFVLKELRTALTKGYQLHVLGYTLHTILLATAETRTVGELDYCLDDVVKVVLDDVFGVVGDEKENKDYISSMREVKGNKSFDSMELLARQTHVRNLSKLVLPFEALLTGTLTPIQTRQVDELFRRIGLGISHGADAGSQDLLIFAFELIKAFYRSKPAQLARPSTNDDKNRERFLVQLNDPRKMEKVSSTSLMYKIAKFAIDIARSSFARHSDLLTPENVHGFIAVIGDALIEGQEDVQISALRLLSTVIKLKMPAIDENVTLYVMEAVKIVRGTVNTSDEIAQAALKLVSAIVRDKHSVQIRDSDVAYLLKRTMPDLQEPDRQGVTFNFVKAVMARKMQLPEVYELADQLGLMMITSQSRNTRDAARGVYVHFLLDYPQGKTRWSKQIKFLVKNLEYQHPEGRQIVMEAISTLLTKVDRDVSKDLSAALFIPIVLRMARDENLRCRGMAGALLSQLFQEATSESLPTIIEPLEAWLEQDENIVLRNVSLQAWSVLFKTLPSEAEVYVESMQRSLAQILRTETSIDEGWESKYHALELANILSQEFPRMMLVQKQQNLWKEAVSMLSHTQPWLQEAAGKLLALFFKDCVGTEEFSVPLTCSHGLPLSEGEVLRILKHCVKIVKSQTSSTELVKITLRNMLHVAHAVAMQGTQMMVVDHESEIMDDGTDNDSDEEEMVQNGSRGTKSIPVVQYLIDQAVYALRREPPKYTSASLQPKINFSLFLATYIPSLSATTLADMTPAITSLLIPLLYITSPATPTPRSVDSLFTETYTQLIESAQAVLDVLQTKLGDQQYMQRVTAATKIAREKRQERRNKRAIGTVAQPERAAREKRKKFEKKKERRKEVKGIHRSLRRKDLGF